MPDTLLHPDRTPVAVRAVHLVTVSLVWWGLLQADPAAAACAEPASAAGLARALGKAELALGNLDASGLGVAVDEAQGVLVCLDEPVPRLEAGRWFRVAGIHRFIGGEEELGVRLLRSARALQPGYRLPASLGPVLAEAWERAAPGDEPTTELPRPAAGYLLIDGEQTRLAADRPFVLQWLDDDGAVDLTAVMIAPDEPLPYKIAAAAPVVQVSPDPPGAVVPAPAEPRPSQAGRPSRALLVGAVGTAAASAGLMLYAASLESRVKSSDQPWEDQRGLVSANRLSGGAGIGLAGAAVGLGATAVVVGRW